MCVLSVPAREAACLLSADLADAFWRVTFKHCCVASWVCACALAACVSMSVCFPSFPGSMIERILVSCNNQQDLQEWVDHLQKQTKVTSVGNPTIKPHSVPSHTVRAPEISSQLPVATASGGAGSGRSCASVRHAHELVDIWGACGLCSEWPQKTDWSGGCH